ncbi:hypothetical protein FIBSPDRAFT_415951 [Athelia psychrophila]|uniref:Uncharacterized protein n=1 Tax=Athelia psychrophila TaxID=1759441 RepID=A0A166N1L9_9AGAM|nr:hypothetical protein FIBSPDRAFT_415951 [Fibularhizoctonia sp. CBS 109695]
MADNMDTEVNLASNVAGDQHVTAVITPATSPLSDNIPLDYELVALRPRTRSAVPKADLSFSQTAASTSQPAVPSYDTTTASAPTLAAGSTELIIGEAAKEAAKEPAKSTAPPKGRSPRKKAAEKAAVPSSAKSLPLPAIHAPNLSSPIAPTGNTTMSRELQALRVTHAALKSSVERLEKRVADSEARVKASHQDMDRVANIATEKHAAEVSTEFEMRERLLKDAFEAQARRFAGIEDQLQDQPDGLQLHDNFKSRLSAIETAHNDTRVYLIDVESTILRQLNGEVLRISALEHASHDHTELSARIDALGAQLAPLTAARELASVRTQLPPRPATAVARPEPNNPLPHHSSYPAPPHQASSSSHNSQSAYSAPPHQASSSSSHQPQYASSSQIRGGSNRPAKRANNGPAQDTRKRSRLEDASPVASPNDEGMVQVTEKVMDHMRGVAAYFSTVEKPKN